MAYFDVSPCVVDRVYTYNNGACFKADPRTVAPTNSECYINILEDGVLYVKDFSIIDGDYLSLDSRTWDGTPGPCGVQVSRGESLLFYMGPYTHYANRDWSHFDVCLVTEWDEREDYTLMGGNGTTRGRNATKGNLYLNGLPVCDHDWGRDEANVVCRKLGFDYGEATTSSYFGALDDNNFLLGKVQCDGDESSIWDCSYETERVCWGSCYSDKSYWLCECNINAGAGVECYNVTSNSNFQLDETVILILAIVFPALAAIGCCVLFWWCWQICHKSNQKNQRVVHVQKVRNVQMENNIRAPNSNTSYQPQRTNMFKDYHRPEVNQVTAYGTNQRATAETNHVVPAAHNNGAAISGPSAPDWTAPPPDEMATPYEPPADE